MGPCSSTLGGHGVFQYRHRTSQGWLLWTMAVKLSTDFAMLRINCSNVTQKGGYCKHNILLERIMKVVEVEWNYGWTQWVNGWMVLLEWWIMTPLSWWCFVEEWRRYSDGRGWFWIQGSGTRGVFTIWWQEIEGTDYVHLLHGQVRMGPMTSTDIAGWALSPLTCPFKLLWCALLVPCLNLRSLRS